MTNVTLQSTALKELAATITRRFDTDGDGRLSADEFAAVLGRLTERAGVDSALIGSATRSLTTSTAAPRFPAPAAPGAGSSQPVVSGAPYTGFSPAYPFEGFDFVREQNPGKSAKDAFAYLANRAPAPPWTDKAALGDWFSQHIRPGMEALGHKINSVSGDKFNFTNWQGTFEVDFVRGAGAPGAALAWQAV